MFSCFDKNKKEESNHKRTTISINLPDSLSIDSSLVGHIEYEQALNPVPNEEIYKKYTFLYATISAKRINTLKELMQVPHDTFVPIDESIIPVYDLESKKKGNVLLQGFLVDQFFYKKNSDSTRIISQDRKVNHPIYVH